VRSRGKVDSIRQDLRVLSGLERGSVVLVDLEESCRGGTQSVVEFGWREGREDERR